MRYCGERGYAALCRMQSGGPTKNAAAPGVFGCVMRKPRVGVCSLGHKRQTKSRYVLQIWQIFLASCRLLAATCYAH